MPKDFMEMLLSNGFTDIPPPPAKARGGIDSNTILMYSILTKAWPDCKNNLRREGYFGL
jgi:hypothetical protein